MSLIELESQSLFSAAPFVNFAHGDVALTLCILFEAALSRDILISLPSLIEALKAVVWKNYMYPPNR